MVTCRWEPHGGSQTLQERQAGHTQHCTRGGGPKCPWGPKLEGLHSARRSSFEWLGKSMEPMKTVRDAYRGILLRQHVGDPHNVAARNASTMRTPCAFSRLWFGPMEPKYKPDPVHVLGDPAAKRCWRMHSMGGSSCNRHLPQNLLQGWVSYLNKCRGMDLARLDATTQASVVVPAAHSFSQFDAKILGGSRLRHWHHFDLDPDISSSCGGHARCIVSILLGDRW